MSENELNEEFEKVCLEAEVPTHMPKRVQVGGRGVLVAKQGGTVYAVDEFCPHKNRSMRYGILFDGEIICPHHHYHFDLETGRCKSRCAPVHTYEVRVIDGEVWIRP